MAQKYCRRLLLVLGYHSRQQKLLPIIIIQEKQKQDHRRTQGESERKVNTCVHSNVYQG